MRKVLPRLRLPTNVPRVGTSWLLGISLAFTAAAIIGGVLGLIGVLALNAQGRHHLNPWDISHGVIQLYTGQSPIWLDPSEDQPTTYDIAKVIAPMSTGYAFVATAAVLLSNRWRLLRAKMARDQSLVCGGGRTGVFLARYLAGKGTTTILIDLDASSERVVTSLVKGIIPISGEARDPVVLQRAGIRRAAEIFAIDEAAEVNAAVAISAKRLAGDRDRPLTCYAVMGDPELQVALQARLLSAVGSPRFRLHLLAKDQLFASAVTSAEPPDPRSRTFVIGSGPLAQALAVEAAKSLWVRAPRSGPLARLSVFGQSAGDIVTAVGLLVPGIAERVAVSVATQEALGSASGGDAGGTGSLDTIYVCETTDAETVRTGFSWLRRAQGQPRRVIFCVDAETGLAGAFTPGEERLFEDMGSPIRFHSRTVALSDADHIRGQTLTEKLAKALHGQYVDHMTPAGTSTTTSVSESSRPWDQLAESFKNSNRDQALGIADKLALLHCVVVPCGPLLPDFDYQDGEIEALSQMEHERWVHERTESGLRPGPQRTAQTHPDLVSWDELGEEAREKDRVFVRALPGLLAGEGFAIVRLS